MTVSQIHIRLLVDCFQECFRFYSETLGHRVEYCDQTAGYAVLEAGITRFALLRRSIGAEAAKTSHLPARVQCQDRFALIYSVDDIDSVCLELEIKGVSFVSGPADRPEWSVRSALLRDPAGNLIEMFSKTEQEDSNT